MRLGFFSELKGVLFDYGGVIEDLQRNSDLLDRGVLELKKLLEEWGIVIELNLLAKMLQSGQKRYEDWYQNNDFREPGIIKLWTDFLLLDIKDQIEKVLDEERADNLSSIYEYYSYKRRVREKIRSVIGKLYLAGYSLGVVSNTMSKSLIPERLKMFNVERFFTTITLSIECGYRKPNPSIFYHALREMDLKPQQCVMIGDTISRDVLGGKKAGIGKVVLMKSGITKEKDNGFGEEVLPDATINNLDEIFEIL